MTVLHLPMTKSLIEAQRMKAPDFQERVAVGTSSPSVEAAGCCVVFGTSSLSFEPPGSGAVRESAVLNETWPKGGVAICKPVWANRGSDQPKRVARSN